MESDMLGSSKQDNLVLFMWHSCCKPCVKVIQSTVAFVAGIISCVPGLYDRSYPALCPRVAESVLLLQIKEKQPSTRLLFKINERQLKQNKKNVQVHDHLQKFCFAESSSAGNVHGVMVASVTGFWRSSGAHWVGSNRLAPRPGSARDTTGKPMQVQTQDSPIGNYTRNPETQGSVRLFWFVDYLMVLSTLILLFSTD